MTPPPFEVADIIRTHGKSFIEKNRSWLTWLHVRVLFAIEHCRTAALGGHWIAGANAAVRPPVSTRAVRGIVLSARPMPVRVARGTRQGTAASQVCAHGLHDPARTIVACSAKQKVVYDLLFRASAATLLAIAADPKHLGAEIGFLSVLHTWGQNLQHHPHVHCVIPSGGLSPDHQRWVHPRYPFFLPVKVLSQVFRGKFIAALKCAFHEGKLVFPGSLKPLAEAKAFHSFLRPLFRHNWVVYAKRPFGGPQHVLQYLARYTHRVAISNHRIVDVADGNVTFRWKDYARSSKQKLMTMTAEEFSPALPASRPASWFRAHSLLRIPRKSAPRQPSASRPGTATSSNSVASRNDNRT